MEQLTRFKQQLFKQAKPFQVMKSIYNFNIYCWMIMMGLFCTVNIQHTRAQTGNAQFKQIATESSSLKWLTLKENQRLSKKDFLAQSQQLFDLDKDNELKAVHSRTSGAWKHSRYQQHYKGVPIEGATYILHEKDELIHTANGDLVQALNLSTHPSLSEAEALNMLLEQIDAEKYAWEDELSESIIKHQLEDENASNYPQGELVIAAAESDLQASNYQLCYVFEVESIEPISHYKYWVNAHTGAILTQNTLLCEYDVIGTCQTHSYGTQAITTDYTGAYYRLKDNGRNIETFTAQNFLTNNLPLWEVEDEDNNWTNDLTACEAHWSAVQTYDYFEEKHARNGYDGLGTKMMLWVNYGTDLVNAYGGGGKIRLGDGDGTNWGALSSLDIVAHEYVHSIIDYTAALNYRRESGALNESFADIFGTVVEYYKDPTGFDWYLGEDSHLAGNGLRDMGNPNNKYQPDTYQGNHWYHIDNCVSSLSTDYCGVHINSGVQNHWFYLLVEGGSGLNDNNQSYDVSGITMAKAAQIAYENLTNYLTENSTYLDAYTGSVEAATALYGANSNEVTQVKAAWCAVGVGTCENNSNGTLSISQPNGGESWGQGLNLNINWTSTGDIGNNVKIEYSINGGSNWVEIIESTPNDGNFVWTVPGYETNLALIRISAVNNNSIIDQSDAYFSIPNCTVNAQFTASEDVICVGSSVHFTNQSTGVNTYSWRINGGNWTNATNFYPAPFTQVGFYTVELKALSNGVCANYTTQTIEVLPATDMACGGNCLASDSLALVAFFEEANGISWNNIWDLNQPVSTWHGVVLSPDGCSVTALQLWNNGLTGGIAPEIGNLSNLTGLYLQNNQLGGRIPEEIGNLSNLTQLFLSNNFLTSSIPSTIGNLINLTDLHLDNNDFDGSIPSTLGNLINLNWFDLANNNLSGEIPNSLGSLPSVIELNLSNNNLSGCYPQGFCSFSDPWYLDFSNNAALPGGGSSDAFTDFCNGIGACATISCLQADSLALVALYYAANGPNWTNTWNLSQAVSTWHGVTLSGDGCSVTELNLNNNQLSGSIPSELGNLSNLTLLHFSGNQLSGNIPSELSNLSNLTGLVLRNNQLDGSIPPALGNLSNLIELSLNDNYLSGNIPPDLGDLSNLLILSLQNNQLSGSIPSALGNLSNLAILILYSNQLSGSIPTELGNLSSLVNLYLYSNQLSGCYPLSLCSLNLNSFNFTNNPSLPDGGSTQGFQDFCAAPTPCNTDTYDVYPGDFNFDGVADYRDLVPLGLYFGELGNSREGQYQDINWSAHPSSNWGTLQSSGFDIKHIDANGDGAVELEDLEALINNYNNTHNASPSIMPNNYTTDSPVEVYLQPASIPSFEGSDNQVVMDIIIEDVNGGDISMYGGYFSIDYENPDGLIENIEVEIYPSWLGVPDTDLEYIVYDDANTQEVNIGITRIDQSNGLGEGQIGRLIATINNETPWDSTTLFFNVNDIAVHNSEAVNLPIASSESLIGIKPNNCRNSWTVDNNNLQSIHQASGLITTNNNLLIDENDMIEFKGNEGDINTGFEVRIGGEFAFYNAPCDNGSNLRPSFNNKSNKLEEGSHNENVDAKEECSFICIKKGSTRQYILSK